MAGPGWIVALAIILVVIAALLYVALRRAQAIPKVVGGAAGRRSANVVVDTLNMVHWLDRRTPKKTAVTTCKILAGIDTAAPLLRAAYPGRVVFVTKTREAAPTIPERNRVRALYQAAARRNGVFIDVVENLPPAGGAKAKAKLKAKPQSGKKVKKGKKSRPHEALARDDFYLVMMARKMSCDVLSRDRFRDLAAMKSGTLPRFQVFRYSPVRATPERNYVNPAAPEFRRLRRPTTRGFDCDLPHV